MMTVHDDRGHNKRNSWCFHFFEILREILEFPCFDILEMQKYKKVALNDIFNCHKLKKFKEIIMSIFIRTPGFE